ncbi:MAG TPA: ester cyclase [Bryobacteraceae bacterium]|nr:ester cyclase [Bryobacteraceae bacterium]
MSAATASQQTIQERNKMATWMFFDEVFNKGNMTAVQILGSSYRFNGQPQDNSQFIGWVNQLRATYPDLKVEFTSSIAEGNSVAIRWQMTGTHQGSGYGEMWAVEAAGNNLLTYSDSGECLSNDQAGFCRRTSPASETFLDSGTLLAPLLQPQS